MATQSDRYQEIAVKEFEEMYSDLRRTGPTLVHLAVLRGIGYAILALAAAVQDRGA